MRPFKEFLDVAKGSSKLTQYNEYTWGNRNNAGYIVYNLSNHQMTFCIVRNNLAMADIKYDPTCDMIMYFHSSTWSRDGNKYGLDIDSDYVPIYVPIYDLSTKPNQYISTEELKILKFIYENTRIEVLTDLCKGTK